MQPPVLHERPVSADARFLGAVCAETVAPAFAAIGLIYLANAMAAPWMARPAPYGEQHRLIHAVACLVLLSCAAFQWYEGVGWRRAHAWLLSAVGLIAVINAWELYTLRDPSHGIYLTLTAFAAGYGFLAPAWFALALAVLSSAWLVPVAAQLAFSPEWYTGTLRLGAGLLASIAVFTTRRRSVIRQEALRRRAEERESAAAEALDEAHVANAKRVTMERIMQAAQRRESLGLMAGGIAHDFNNLLTVIGGNLEVVQDELEATSPLHGSLADAMAATDHAARLTRQMLAYAGRAEPRVARIELGARVQQVVRMLASSLPPGVTVRERGSEPGPVVEADGAQLDQVMINLIQNAVDACRESGGTIDVDWGLDWVDRRDLASMRFGAASPPGSYAFFEVQDDGHGMEKAVRDHMFEPFFTTKEGGSGLGLAAVEGIAERHSAALVISSAQGAGTCFRFLLPHHAVLEPEAPVLSRPLPTERGSILLVDDEESVRRVTRRALERSGYAVVDAASGREALALAEEHARFDAALLDLTMPGMNGRELASLLRERAPAMPVVLMSGFDREEVMTAPGSGDGYVFLSKPFTSAKLADAIREAAGVRDQEMRRGGAPPRLVHGAPHS